MYGAWALSYGSEAFPFESFGVGVSGWKIGGRVYRVDDASAPRADNVLFGQDFADPGDIELSLIIRVGGASNEERFDAAVSARERFDAMWDAPEVRGTPGAVAELNLGGRTVVEGRPRHIDWDDSDAWFGVVRGTALFVRSSLTEYDAASGWQTATMRLVPARSGGIRFPLRFPLRTTAESTSASQILVEGAKTWPIITVQGPIQSGVQVESVQGRWRLFLNQALTERERAVIDTRPGHRSTLLNSQPRQLLDPRSSLLAECTLLPGGNTIALRGASIEGTASVSVSWRTILGGM